MKFKLVVFILILLLLILTVFLDFRGDAEKYEKAIKNEDSSLCESIWNTDLKFNCKGKIENDPEICDRINENTVIDDFNVRDDCFRHVAFRQHNPELCEKIVFLMWRDICYYELSLIRKDSKLCAKMSNQTIDSNMWTIENQSISTCLRDTCYDQAIGFEPDESLCNNIENPQLRNDCLPGISYVKNKIENISPQLNES